MDEACNGFHLRGLNQDCNRVSVQSSVANTWMMTYKKHAFARAAVHEVGMNRDEIIVVKCQDGSGHAEIEIRPLGGKSGTLIAQSSRKGQRTLRVGGKYRFELDPGEAVVLRTSSIVHPSTAGAGLAV